MNDPYTVSTLGQFISSLLSSFCSVYKNDQAKVDLELGITQWLAEGLGFPETSKGVFCPNVLSCDVLCFTAMRYHVGLRKRHRRPVLYILSVTENAFSESLYVTGMTEDFIVKNLKLDDTYLEKLEAELAADDKNDDILPALLAVNLVGWGFDASLARLQTLCGTYRLWCHLTLDQVPSLLDKNIELNANSASLDVTRCFAQPNPTSVFFMKEPQTITAALCPTSQPTFFQQTEMTSFFWYTIEVSRPCQAIGVWFFLSLLGMDRVKAYVKKLHEATE